jgi:hypothetical protein
MLRKLCIDTCFWKSNPDPFQRIVRDSVRQSDKAIKNEAGTADGGKEIWIEGL